MTFLKKIFIIISILPKPSLGELIMNEEKILIITKGRGGDANGAKLLLDTWENKKPDLINLSNGIKLSDLNIK